MTEPKLLGLIALGGVIFLAGMYTERKLSKSHVGYEALTYLAARDALLERWGDGY